MIGLLTRRAWKPLPEIQDWKRAIRNAGEDAVVFAPEDVHVQVRQNETTLWTRDGMRFAPDLVFLRIKPGPGADLIDLLDEAGWRLVNPARAWRVCNDKALQAAAFALNGVPHPLSLFSYGGDLKVPEPPPGGVKGWVAKPRHGRRGLGVRLLTGRHRTRRSAGRVPASEGPLGPDFLQELVNPPGQVRWHVRCNVIGGRAVAAGTQVATEGRFVSNRAQGGLWTLWSGVPDEIAELSLAAAHAVGAEQVGVDLIQDEHGRWWVLECNEMAEYGPPSFAALVDYLVAEARIGRSSP